MTAPEFQIADCGISDKKPLKLPKSSPPDEWIGGGRVSAALGETKDEMKRCNNSTMTVAKVHSLTHSLK